MPAGRFAPVSDPSSRQFEGAPLSRLGGDTLLRRAAACGVPKSLGDEQQLRLVLAALLTLSDSGEALPPGCFSELREEAKGLLLLAARRDRHISDDVCEALNVLNKPQVVEKYKALGNRWTIPEASRDGPSAVERARKELDSESTASTREWLRSLADTLEAPAETRPWYTSRPVQIVLALSALFLLAHIVLLVRVLQKVHVADNQVLLYPIAGLSASAVVGVFALCIHRMSEPSSKRE
jgi:hypothetical protein